MTVESFAEIIARTAEWESSARSYVNSIPVVFERGEGPWLIDLNGRRYLDFLTGAGVLLLGHNHPAVSLALAGIKDPVITSLDLMTKAKLDFLETFRAFLPGQLAQTHKVHFCGPTGSDAIEAALKLAAHATGRPGVIAFCGSYHGMTQGALSVTSKNHLRAFGLKGPAEVAFCPFPYPRRFPKPFDEPEAATDFCLASLKLMLEDDHSGVSRPGLVLLEVVQGEGGNLVGPPRFIQGVAELCARHGLLLAVDEIQAGLGRTGRIFAFERYGLTPDLITVSKGVGGGFPLSLLLFHRRLDTWRPGQHIGTFRGQQFALTAGRAVLETIRSEGLAERAEAAGARLKEGLLALAGRYPCLAEVRGLGLYLGVELAGQGGATPGRMAALVQARLLDEGVVAETGGREGAVLRLLPPLTIGPAEVEFFLSALDRVMVNLARS